MGRSAAGASRPQEDGFTTTYVSKRTRGCVLGHVSHQRSTRLPSGCYLNHPNSLVHVQRPSTSPALHHLLLSSCLNAVQGMRVRHQRAPGMIVDDSAGSDTVPGMEWRKHADTRTSIYQRRYRAGAVSDDPQSQHGDLDKSAYSALSSYFWPIITPHAVVHEPQTLVSCCFDADVHFTEWDFEPASAIS